MENPGQYFGAITPPPPFGIAILQICFQVACLAAAFISINYVVEGVKDNGLFFFLPGMVKEEVNLRELNSEMEMVSQSFIFANRHETVVVAMSKAAVSVIQESCKRFNGDRLAFCKMDMREALKNSSESGPSVDKIEFDAIAISNGGKMWTPLIMAEAEKERLTKQIHSKDSVVDSWLLKLVLGKPDWKSAADEEVPIKYPSP